MQATLDDAAIAALSERLGTTADVIREEQQLHFEGVMMKLEEMQNVGAANAIGNLSLRALWRKYCGAGDAVQISSLREYIRKYLVDDLHYDPATVASSLWSPDVQTTVFGAIDTDRNELVRNQV